MTDPLPSLDELEKKIAEARQAHTPPSIPEPSSNAGMAMRMGVELVSGVGVGCFIGYHLDRWLGTSPWMFILCFLLGTAGGFLSMYRSMAAMQARESDDTKQP